MNVYFNEIDKYPAEWLGNLFPGAFVDHRSIKDVRAAARMGRLRAYGNAIIPQVAALFIRAFLETEQEAKS